MAVLDELALPLSERSPSLPSGRGPLSRFLLEHLRRPVHRLPRAPEPADDPLAGDDIQLFLYLCYELHYRGLAGVDEAWEWEPSLLALRRSVETAFEEALVRRIGPPSSNGADMSGGLRAVIAQASGPSLSRFLLEHGTLEQFREFAVHRSGYQLKEADPHSWVIPRLWGVPKAALIEIQSDEYGGGEPGLAHADLFANTMDALGLDSTYGAYVDCLPGPTLATTNLVSFLGLHRRWRGALVGHLAVFEMTSVEPMGRYSETLRRLGLPRAARRFYDVHVEADARHERIAADELAAGLAASEPGIAGDILFGARAIMAVEERFTAHLLNSWSAGTTSLRFPL
ncbi:MAG TPA: iron-containing redox enzyme family protein [Acidimicrobiia bacterium]|nr:iron-containing redox enzyme family protein [Acidimicrobiia bacterium]